MICLIRRRAAAAGGALPTAETIWQTRQGASSCLSGESFEQEKTLE
ncbi:hypothetical protein KCP70_17930 [Salmonella enterica subsp. enterica]|nr:hypothetical protein KCP70_17930 [Salmonella enterica subsp. enterica]